MYMNFFLLKSVGIMLCPETLQLIFTLSDTGGDISIVVTSGNETKISAVREAFQLVFGKAVVEGVAVQASSIAPQPVGFSAGLKAAEERINNLRQQGFTQDHQVILAVENFITELTPEK